MARASGSYGTYSLAADLVLALFVLMTLLVNAIAVVELFVSRQTRGKLLTRSRSLYSRFAGGQAATTINHY